MGRNSPVDHYASKQTNRGPHNKADRPHNKTERPHNKADRPHNERKRPHNKVDRPHNKPQRPHNKIDRHHDKKMDVLKILTLITRHTFIGCVQIQVWNML